MQYYSSASSSESLQKVGVELQPSTTTYSSNKNNDQGKRSSGEKAGNSSEGLGGKGAAATEFWTLQLGGRDLVFVTLRRVSDFLT